MHEDFAIYALWLCATYMHEDIALYTHAWRPCAINTCMKTLRYIHMHEAVALYTHAWRLCAIYTCMKTLRYIYMHEDFARYTCMKTLRYIPMHEDAALYMTTTHTHVQALFMHAHMHTYIRIHDALTQLHAHEQAHWRNCTTPQLRANSFLAVVLTSCMYA